MIRSALIVLVAAAGLGAGLGWLAHREPPREVSAEVAAFDLTQVRALGELRLVIAEISVLQREGSLDQTRQLDVVIPVRLVLGLDLTKVAITRTASAWEVTLPPVRLLARSSEAARWTVWRSQGALQAAGERLSLAELAELRAFHQADLEASRLGLRATAEQRARAAISAWAGPIPVRFTVAGTLAP
jgi:hypothetical protein